MLHMCCVSEIKSQSIIVFLGAREVGEVFQQLQKLGMFFTTYYHRIIFVIPSHNANTERGFTLMRSQWTKERNKLLA